MSLPKHSVQTAGNSGIAERCAEAEDVGYVLAYTLLETTQAVIAARLQESSASTRNHSALIAKESTKQIIQSALPT